MNPSKKQKPHYAWFILAGCCVMQGASLGLINNCAGVFYAPVCADMGFEMGDFSAYKMLSILGSALTLPMVAKVFRKKDIRLVLSLAAVVYGGTNVAMGFFQELWQWYAAGFIQGMASAFLTMIAAPIILANWFRKKTGTAVGISAAFSGLMGMMGSSGLGISIPSLGWRLSYILVGCISMALILPVSVFVLRYRPEQMGLLAYGEEEMQMAEKNAGATAAAATAQELALKSFARQPLFYLSAAVYALAMAASALNSFLTPCGLAVGLSMAAAAMLTSLSLLGNTLSKFVLGKACDSCGTLRTFLAALLISAAGHLMLLSGTPNAVMAGALFYGITLPISSVMLPLFCQLFWRGDTYGAAYSYISMAGTFVSAPCSMLFGTFYDMTGGYGLTITVSLACVLFMGVLVLAGGRSVRIRPSQAQ